MVDAILEVCPHERIPAASRGTGNPALFERVAQVTKARPGSRLLHVGCGLGGPAAWLARATKATVVGVDIMETQVGALLRLFPEIQVAVADSRRLPFGDESFDAAVVLGVLETIDHKRAVLEEIHRILAPGSSAYVFGYAPRSSEPLEVPDADRFERAGDLAAAMSSAGFEVAALPTPNLEGSPPEWLRLASRVREVVERDHQDDPRYRRSAVQIDKLTDLFGGKSLEAWEFVLRKAA